VPIEESFAILAADLALPPTTSDPNEIGTTFIYEPNFLFNATELRDNGGLVELEDSRITGVCTRTSSTLGSDIGGGVCHFTILADGISVNFGGFIEDLVEGAPDSTLAISGGTGFLSGITGEVALHPYDGNGDDFTGDIFSGAFTYEIMISGVLVFCDDNGGF
jgi:hypothetical protein